MKYLALFFCLFSIPYSSLTSEEIKYPVSEIPQDLMKNANVIVRESKESFTVNDPGMATHTVKVVYTILNKKGDDYAKMIEWYDQLKKVNYIRGNMYNDKGVLISSLKKADIIDRSYYDGFSLYTDNRMKIAAFVNNTYPYTVEFEYESTWDGLLLYPSWHPQPEAEVAVQSAELKITMPPSLKLRFQEINLQDFSDIGNEQVASDNKTTEKFAKIGQVGALKTYTWNLENIPASESEIFQDQELPKVIMAPSLFEVEGYHGDLSSWKSFGDWINLLNSKGMDLPKETQEKMRAMVAGISDPKEKVRKIYEYLQSKVRYVSIQVGIGGWKPFPASYVDEKGYGDCKALSNYTKSLLNAIGIESYYALIRGGQNEPRINVSFPSTQFNHAILCVPLEKDTVWLECTSQQQAFGYMGNFTDDRDALVITPEGGKIVHTPIYSKDENLLIRKGNFQVGKDGNAIAEISTLYRALQEDTRAFISDRNTEEQKKWLLEHIDIPNFELMEFSLTRNKSQVASVIEKLKLNILKCASVSGKRLFLVPKIIEPHTYVPPMDENRNTEVVLNRFYDFKDVDTLVYTIPTGYEIEYIPKNISIESLFGKYTSTFSMEGNQLTYIRQYEMNKGRYPKESYQSLVDFYKQITKADQSKVVFVDKSTN